MYRTYHIVLGYVEHGPEGGGEAAAAVVGLPPCEASTAVNDRRAVGVGGCCPLEEHDGAEGSKVGFAFRQVIHG